MKVPTLIFLTCLLSNCLALSSALFFKGFKKYAGYGYGHNSGYGSYPANYGSNYNGGYGYGYNSGYGSYPANYGSNYNGGYGYGYNSGYNNYNGGYGSGYNRPSKGQRTGRTYSDIRKTLYPDPYLGLGAGRYQPRAPFSHLWG